MSALIQAGYAPIASGTNLAEVCTKVSMSMARPQYLRLRAALSSLLATTAGGALDAWVYLGHGHVFANAQSGNVVLIGVALADGEPSRAARHLPSLLAYVAGLLVSRLAADRLKALGLNSRTIRLGVVCLLLTLLALVADRLADGVVTAWVGFTAAVQTTSLSHFGRWSFNTGMTTGNMRSAAVAIVRAWDGDADEWPHALVMGALCLSFLLGAVLGGWLSPRLHGLSLVVLAGLVVTAALVAPQSLDPLPDWKDLASPDVTAAEERP